jgi:hypothetical protein
MESCMRGVSRPFAELRWATWRMLDPSSSPSASPVHILKPISADDSAPYVAMRGEGSTQY